MDNCSARVTENVIRLLKEARVCVIICAPHTTQIFRVLVLTLFGVLQSCLRYELSFENDHATVKVIVNARFDFRQTMEPSNVCGSLTLSWTSYRAGDVLLGSVGSTAGRKMDWH
jgi:hypothetical protein